MCETTGHSILGVVTSIASLAGFAMMYASLFYRRDDAPMIGSRDPKDKAPIWKLQSRYRGPGYTLLIAGVILVFGGSLIHTIFAGW